MARWMMPVWLCVLLSAGCGASTQSVVSMTLNSGLALGAAAASRSQGGCYAICTAGSVCNPDTGMCERMTCNGLCGERQTCDDSGPLPRCIDDPALAAPPVEEPMTSPLPY
jgi:hypothetical protein